MTARGNRLQLPLQDGALDASCTLIAQDCSDLNSEVRQNSFLLTGGKSAQACMPSCQMLLTTTSALLCAAPVMANMRTGIFSLFVTRRQCSGAVVSTMLVLQFVANMGLSGVEPGSPGDVVFIRAVKDDKKSAGTSMQTEVSNTAMQCPLT